MTDPQSCPKCGAPTAGGPCPRCLLAAGLESGAPGASAPTAPSPGEMQKHFPALEVQELLGQGGMGIVYRARQRNLDRPVALKVLLPEIARESGFAERFTREARTLARLQHPHIVGVHDFGESDGLWFLVMEFVDGANLRQVMKAGGLGPKEALAIVPQVCDALQYAHDQGIVHRDIKPENILVDRAGRVKIADFGLAKLLQRAPVELNITRTGQVMGTLHYMAPEQYRSPEGVDHRADIYSLGVVFYEMLTGELPLGAFPRPSERAGVDARLDGVVLRALERERDQRYQKAEEVKSAVTSITTGAGSAPTAVSTPAGPSPGAAAAPAAPGAAGTLDRFALAGGLSIPAALLAGVLVTGFGRLVGAGTSASAAGVWTFLLVAMAGWVSAVYGWARIHHSGGRLVGKPWAVAGTVANPLLMCCPGWIVLSGAPAPADGVVDSVHLPFLSVEKGTDGGKRVRMPFLDVSRQAPPPVMAGNAGVVALSEFENAPASMDAAEGNAILRSLDGAWDDLVRVVQRPSGAMSRSLLVRGDRETFERMTEAERSRELLAYRLGAPFLPDVSGAFEGSEPKEMRLARVILSSDRTRARVIRTDGRMVLSYPAAEEGGRWRFALGPVERVFVRGGPATATPKWRADAVRGLERMWLSSGEDLLKEHFPGTDLADRASHFRIHALALRPNSTSGRMVWSDGGATISLACRFVAGRWEVLHRAVQRLDREPRFEDRDGWLGAEPEPAEASGEPGAPDGK